MAGLLKRRSLGLTAEWEVGEVWSGAPECASPTLSQALLAREPHFKKHSLKHAASASDSFALEREGIPRGQLIRFSA